MKFHASHRYVRISPRKARYVIDLIRNKSANEALEILRCVPKRAAYFTKKVLNSAVANAQDANVNNLVILEARVDAGPVLKRFRPGPMGRAMRIHKKTSHINITLIEKPSTVLAEKPSKKTGE